MGSGLRQSATTVTMGECAQNKRFLYQKYSCDQISRRKRFESNCASVVYGNQPLQCRFIDINIYLYVYIHIHIYIYRCCNESPNTFILLVLLTYLTTRFSLRADVK